jgi:hypothetical protein
VDLVEKLGDTLHFVDDDPIGLRGRQYFGAEEGRIVIIPNCILRRQQIDDEGSPNREWIKVLLPVPRGPNRKEENRGDRGSA